MKHGLMSILVALIVGWVPTSAFSDQVESGFAEVPKATVLGADFTNLWYNPSESGWGVNIIHQQGTLFATLFVYGSDSRPLWLVGPAVNLTGSDSSAIAIFSGTLYQTTGPVHTGSFNPNAVGLSTVGTVSFRFRDARTAQMTYTYNGATVTKNIVPQVWANSSLAGTFIGGSFGATATCGAPVQTGNTTMTWTITHTGNTATIVNAASGCTMTGTVTQAGKHAAIYGNYSCTGGRTGQFGLEYLEVGLWGLTGLYISVNDSGCSGKVATIGMARQ